MPITVVDPESSEPQRYFGGTVTTSGSSAVVPEYTPYVLANARDYYPIFKDDTEEGKAYIKQFRDIVIKQMNKSAEIDVDTYYTHKKYGIVIFISVILLVTIGVLFSGIQLSNAIKYGNYAQLLTTIEIQKAGNVIITSSVIGAFVLTASLVFFFLFLKYVYKPNSQRKNIFKNFKAGSSIIKELED